MGDDDEVWYASAIVLIAVSIGLAMRRVRVDSTQLTAEALRASKGMVAAATDVVTGAVRTKAQAIEEQLVAVGSVVDGVRATASGMSTVAEGISESRRISVG